jgi:hypothetical protein
MINLYICSKLPLLCFSVDDLENVIIFIIVVVVAVSCRQRNVTGRTVYTTPNISGQTIITQSGSQQMTGIIITLV